MSIANDKDYKGEYNRLFPAKMSSSSFLTLYSLRLLDKYGSMYGMEIINHITDELGSGVWRPSHGTLYPLLSDLEKSGLVKSQIESHSKRYYTITDTGRTVLGNKLKESKRVLFDSYNFLHNVINDLYGKEEGK